MPNTKQFIVEKGCMGLIVFPRQKLGVQSSSVRTPSEKFVQRTPFGEDCQKIYLVYGEL